MKALVTGGGGFLGLSLVERLLARGDQVRVLCRGCYATLDELGVETHRADIRDAAAVCAACEGVDAVFHVAAIAGIWGAWKTYYGINTEGTRNVIAGCRKHEVPRLIYTSSPSVVYDGREHLNADESLPYSASYQCYYPHTKAIAEREVLAANDERLATVALRPHLIWGPRDNHLIPRLIGRARSGRLRRVGSGDNVVSMSYVENVALAHVQAAEALSPGSRVAGQAYFINEPEPVRLWEWVDQILALAGLPAVQKSVSAATARRIGAAAEGIYRMLHLPGEPPMTRFLASQLSSSHYYSIEKARRDFGYAPVISVEEGMRRLGNDLKRVGLSR